MALIALVTFGLAAGQCHRGWHDKDRDPAEISEKIADKIAGKLDLDDSQEAETRKIVEELVISGKQMKSKRGDLTAELQKQFESDAFDPEQLEQISGTLESDMQNFRKLAISKLGEFHKLLNEEQRKEAAELLARINKHNK